MIVVRRHSSYYHSIVIEPIEQDDLAPFVLSANAMQRTKPIDVKARKVAIIASFENVVHLHPIYVADGTLDCSLTPNLFVCTSFRL